MPYTTSKTLSNHATSVSAADILSNAYEFIPSKCASNDSDKLYFISMISPPQQYPNTNFFTIDNMLVYVNFYADFGPLNMSHVFRFCDIMSEKLHVLLTRLKSRTHLWSTKRFACIRAPTKLKGQMQPF